jgi:hypothetical protein
MRLLFVALGSLGDVWGHVLVAHRITNTVSTTTGAERRETSLSAVVMVCESVVEPLRALCAASSIPLLLFSPVPSDTSTAESKFVVYPLAVPVIPTGIDVQSELDLIWVAVRSFPGPPFTAVVFNLNSLFGYHIADALCVPRAVLSPTVPAVVPSASAVLDVIRKHPTVVGTAGVTRHGIAHWMLPLFCTHYEEWRRRHGLPDTATAMQKFKPTFLGPLLYGFSSLCLPAREGWPVWTHLCGNMILSTC